MIRHLSVASEQVRLFEKELPKDVKLSVGLKLYSLTLCGLKMFWVSFCVAINLKKEEELHSNISSVTTLIYVLMFELYA